MFLLCPKEDVDSGSRPWERAGAVDREQVLPSQRLDDEFEVRFLTSCANAFCASVVRTSVQPSCGDIALEVRRSRSLDRAVSPLVRESGDRPK